MVGRMAQKPIINYQITMIFGFIIGLLLGLGFIMLYMNTYMDNCKEGLDICIEHYNQCRTELYPIKYLDVNMNITR